MEDKFLPIGTVVLLKNGKKELMITGYCIMPTGEVYDKSGKVEEKKMLDYGACLYPEGLISSTQTFAFNHENIDKIIYMGYKTDKQKELSNILNEGLKKLAEKQETSKENKEAEE